MDPCIVMQNMCKQFQECFTYIDKVHADEAAFKQWLQEKEQLEAASTAQAALQRMLAHPLFKEFCRVIGAEEGEWGQSEHAEHEVAIFEEYLVEKEMKERRRLAEESIRPPTAEEIAAIRMADMPSNAETQLALRLQVIVRMGFCMHAAFNMHMFCVLLRRLAAWRPNALPLRFRM